MDGKYVMAIDGGTQSMKVLIVDFQGRVVSEGQRELQPTIAPKLGYVEHPGDDLWDSLIVACKKAMAGFPGKKEEIVAVGLCTIRSCRVYLRKDGSLAYPVIDWMDNRAFGPFVFPTTDSVYATTTTGYMTHRLTGQFRDTVANCTNRAWPTDMDHWRWTDDDGVFRSYQLKREQMMELCMPGSVLGCVTKEAAEVTGIPAGIPVIATANDKAVEALGTGLSLQKETGMVTLGTYISSMICGTENRQNTNCFWTNFASVPYQYLYESFGIRRGMWTVSWLKNLIGDEVALKAKKEGISSETYLDREAASVPAGSEGLLTVVEWLGAKGLEFKKGVMLGFDVRHSRAHMYRSIMEGIAFTMKNLYTAMCDELGVKPKKIIVSGGGSSGNAFMQIFADMFGVPAYRNEMNGAAGLGSAICAAVGVGVYKSFDEAAQAMVRTKDEFAPDETNHALYSKINEDVYRDITRTTDVVLKKSYPIFNRF